MNAEPRANILLVDDRPENLLALEEILRPLDQNLVRARSGSEALKCLLTDEFAVILLDVQMPAMDGFETAARIKDRERTRHVPIIFLTAISREVRQQLHGYEVGAVDYLAKPYEPWVLRSKVAVFIELHNQRRVLEEQASLLVEKTEQLEQANAAMRDFVAIASHDLRHPITVIAGSAATLKACGAQLAAEQQDALMVAIERQANQLVRLVDDLLAVSKLDVGVVDVNSQPVVVEDFVLEVLADLTVDESAVTVRAPARLVARADPDHLRRILRNYVDNALRHGAPPVEIDLREAGASVEIRVLDSGEGVPADFVPRLFNRFARAQARPGDRRGSGLGLSIVHGLAQAGGGEAWYEPRHPTGSCFAVRLPKDRSGYPAG